MTIPTNLTAKGLWQWAKSNTQAFNAEQDALGILGQRPLLCLNRSPYCQGCEPGSTFVCDCCSVDVPWCRGADDDRPDWCDFCVAEFEQEKQK